jgi:magnesium-transporting ATPase (P-type)
MTTVISRGRGKGIVVRTGESTEIGKISKAISSTLQTKSQIEHKLSKLGMWLVIIAVVLVGLIIVIGISWKRDAKAMTLIGISLAVSVIPEGLVAVVTGMNELIFSFYGARSTPNVKKECNFQKTTFCGNCWFSHRNLFR